VKAFPDSGKEEYGGGGETGGGGNGAGETVLPERVDCGEWRDEDVRQRKPRTA